MADVEEPQVDEAVEEPKVEEEEFVAVGGATAIKLFGKWPFDDIEIRDISLVVSRITHLHYVCMHATNSTATKEDFVLYYKTVSNDCCYSILFYFYYCSYRITLPAKVITPRTFPTRRVATRRSDFARHHARLSSDWLAA